MIEEGARSDREVIGEYVSYGVDSAWVLFLGIAFFPYMAICFGVGVVLGAFLSSI